MERIIDKIERQIATGVYPGASLALYNQQWQEYYLGSQDGREPVKPGLVYDLASVSKVVGVGTVFASLYHKGELDLDRSLASYYPAVDHKEVTLRQLLTHTSGIDPYIPDRDNLNERELRDAINRIGLTSNRAFHYTDINFLLLGFMLEERYGQSLDRIFREEVFEPFGMRETSFGPVQVAVPTVKGVKAGLVHDPKARVLGYHAGSAGLFSTLKDMEVFLETYLQSDFAASLNQVYGGDEKRERSLAWDKKGDWLSHTGYTGTFIMYHRRLQKAAIFLSNRTFYKDERAQWKRDRNDLMQLIMAHLEQESSDS